MRESHEAQRQRRTGAFIKFPADGHGEHLLAEQRHQAAQKIKREVPVPENRIRMVARRWLNRRRRQIFWQFSFLHGCDEDEGSSKSATVESFASVAGRRYNEIGMDNQHERRLGCHNRPWFVLAAFLLGVALAVLWISFEVRKVEQERDLNAPLPSSPAGGQASRLFLL